jgi:hypothetical protein
MLISSPLERGRKEEGVLKKGEEMKRRERIVDPDLKKRV